MTLDNFLTYLRAAGLSQGTIRLRGIQLRRIEARLGPLLDLTHTDLIGWLGQPEWKPETRKSERAAMTTFYRWAVEEQLLSLNPTSRLPRVKVPASVPRPLPSQVLAKALRDGISDRDRLMVHLAAFAGLRRAEIAELRWSSITDDLRVTGKGGVTRMIPLLPELRVVLDAERLRRAAGGWGTGWRFAVDPESPFVLPGMDGWSHISADCTGRAMTRLLGGGWTAHTARHRFATEAYSVERDLLAVQQMLGHSSTDTTSRYIAVSSEAKRRAVAGTWIEAAA